MKSATTEIRVFYDETDQMGVVHHSNYAKYCEKARWEAFRELGISYKDIEDEGYFLPVISMTFDFIKPAFYDEILTIKTLFEKIKGARIVLKYEIYNQKGELINIGSTDLAITKKSNMKPIAPPDYFYKLFED